MVASDWMFLPRRPVLPELSIKLGACGLLKPAGDAAAQVSKMPRTPRLRVLPRAMRVVARALGLRGASGL